LPLLESQTADGLPEIKHNQRPRPNRARGLWLWGSGKGVIGKPAAGTPALPPARRVFCYGTVQRIHRPPGFYAAMPNPAGGGGEPIA